MAGLVLGGGGGFSQRLHGLTCDQLVETEIVNAGGELLTCNAEQNADVFWACRGGGGGNFGVNVSLTFQTFPADVMTVFRLVWNARLEALLPAALELLPTTPDRLGCKLLIDAGDAPELELLGQLAGTEDELAALFGPPNLPIRGRQPGIRARELALFLPGAGRGRRAHHPRFPAPLARHA